MGLLAALGCASGDPHSNVGGQTGEESFGCLTTSTETLPLSETTRLGFSGDDMLALVQGESTATFTWSDSSQTLATVSVTVTDSTVEIRDNEWKAPQDGREIGTPDCEDTLAVEAELTFVTDDGAFDESFDVVLVSETQDRVQVYVAYEVTDIEGNYEVTEVNTTERRVRLFWTLTFDAQGLSGSIDGQAEDVAGNSPDGTVSAEGFDIGMFGEE